MRNLPVSYLPPRSPGRTWTFHDYVEPSGAQEIPFIESQQPIGVTVYGGLQDHLVIGITQHRPPQVRNLDRLADRAQRIKQSGNLFGRRATVCQMLRSG